MTRPETSDAIATGFDAEATRDATLLVVGSLPGIRSIKAGEYYAHPRNVFWRIMDALYDIPAELPYRERIRALNRAGVALWDVLHASRRSGSLDVAIEHATAVPNNFNAFFKRYPKIDLVAFNGRKAAELFRRFVMPQLDAAEPQQLLLPSTSPAHAAMSFEQKLRCWQKVLE